MALEFRYFAKFIIYEARLIISNGTSLIWMRRGNIGEEYEVVFVHKAANWRKTCNQTDYKQQLCLFP